MSSFNLKCQYMSVYAMVGITRSKVIVVMGFDMVLGTTGKITYVLYGSPPAR